MQWHYSSFICVCVITIHLNPCMLYWHSKKSHKNSTPGRELQATKMLRKGEIKTITSTDYPMPNDQP